MKVIYEISDEIDDRTNMFMHKYAEDMYFALSHISAIIRAEMDGLTENDKEKLMDAISDEIFLSKIHDVE